MSDVLNETEEIVKKAKSLGADEVIAKTTFGKYRQSRFSNNEIDTTVAWNDYVTDITLSWKKKSGGNSGTQLSKCRRTVKATF